MRRKLTTDEFKVRVFDLVQNDYTVCGEYQRAQQKIRMKHNVCGTEYEVTPGNFLSGRRCPHCHGNEKKTLTQFKEEVHQLVGKDYTVLGEYQGALQKIRMKHQLCGTEWEVRPNTFLGGSRCPHCHRNAKKNTTQFKEEVAWQVGQDYTVLGEYQGARQKIRMKHNVCGTEWEVKPTYFLSGNRCPHCFGNAKKTTAQFKEEVHQLVGNTYTVLGEYQGTLQKIRMKHQLCGTEWEIRPNDFLRGRRCPHCAKKKTV